MRTQLAIRRNIKLISWYAFLVEFRLLNVVSVLFYTAVSGSYALGMSIFTIALFSTAFFEIPTGILSDKIGRKYTMTLGTFCDFVSTVLYACGGLYNSYVFLAVAALVEGVACSLYSGTEKALLYETVKELRQKKNYHKIFGRISSIGQVSLALSAAIGGAVAYYYSYTLVACLTVIPIFLCFLITFFYVEPKVHAEGNDNYSVIFKEACKLFKQNKKLQLFATASAMSYSFGDTFYRFQIAFFEHLIPLWLIGVVRMIKQFGGAIGFWFAGQVIDRFGHMKVLIGGSVISTAIAFVAVALNSIASPFLLALLNFEYGASSTAKSQLMQEEFSDKQRATMGSIVSLVGSVLFGIVSTFTGWLADVTSISTALYFLLVPDLLVIWIYWKALRHG